MMMTFTSIVPFPLLSNGALFKKMKIIMYCWKKNKKQKNIELYVKIYNFVKMNKNMNRIK